MKPLRIVAHNCKAYRDLDLDVSGVRHAVVIGANGAGKSLLVDLIRIALFDIGRLGPRALAGLIGPWGSVASVQLDFEHAGHTYRSTRTRRNSGKTTSRTDVMQVLRDGQWDVTSQTAEQILGVSAATMNATTFLRSRGAEGLGDFGAATPEERRGILYDLRRANRYEAFEAAAKERAADARRRERLASDSLARITQEIDAAEAIVSSAAGSDDRIKALRLELEQAELALASARAKAASIARLRQDADDAMRASLLATREHVAAVAAVQDCEKRIAAYAADLADEVDVRSAAERKAQLGERWRSLIGEHRAAAAELAGATQLLDAASLAFRSARDQNLQVEDRARLVGSLNLSSSRADLLRPLCDAQASLKRAHDEIDRERQRSGLSAEIATATASIAQLEAVLELLLRVGRLQGSVEGDEAWVRGLADVPCLGEGKFAACSYLAAAVEARGRLDPLRAEAAAAVMALAEAEGGLSVAVSGAGPVSTELNAMRRKLSSLQMSLAAVPPTSTREEIEIRLAELTALASSAADACAWEDVSVAADSAFLAASRAAEHAQAQLTMVPDRPKVDTAPLEVEVARLSAEVAVRQARVAELDAELSAVRADGEKLGSLASRLSAVDVAAGAVASERASLPAYQAAVASAASRRALAREADERASAEVIAADTSSTSTAQAEATIAALRGAVTDLDVAAAAAAAARRSLATLDERRQGVEAERAAAALAVSLATTAARFYSEAPALIVENDRAVIEKAANDWLSRTSAMSVELVMQRALKGDTTRVRETLDVDVTRPSGVGVREGCSAGELFRVDIGLAMAIGHAAGNGRSWMVIDEGFGTLKQDVLVAVARELGQVLADLDGLWVVEHNPLIIDQFPVRIVVSAGSDGSTVEIQG